MQIKCEMKTTSEILRARGLEEGGRVQKFVDSEVIRLSEPYTPFRTGFLKNNAPKLGTVVGTGYVIYKAPYAKRQYYTNSGRLQTGKRGKMWFERMKADKKQQILDGAKQIAGAK